MRLRPEILGVVESPLVQIATMAEDAPGALKLCNGESEMPTPELVCRAADEAARAGHTFYTHTAGCPELRETGVAPAPGTAFGESGEGHVRLCFAANEATLADALDRLRAFMTGARAAGGRRAGYSL